MQDLDPPEQGQMDGLLAAKYETGRELTAGEVVIDALDPYLEDGVDVDGITMSIAKRESEEVEGLMLPSGKDGTYRRVGFFKAYVKPCLRKLIWWS